MSDRVVTTTDSIAQARHKAVAIATITPTPEDLPTAKPIPDSTPIFEASEVESKGLKIAELVEKLGKTRQAIESARSKGTLSEIGYRAEKNGRNWLYYPLENVTAH